MNRVANLIAAAFRTILTADGRRAWALLALVGGCVMFTGLAGYAMHLVRWQARLVFWLGIAAHAQVLVGLTALGALLVKRRLEITRDGVTITDDKAGGSDVQRDL